MRQTEEVSFYCSGPVRIAYSLHRVSDDNTYFNPFNVSLEPACQFFMYLLVLGCGRVCTVLASAEIRHALGPAVV